MKTGDYGMSWQDNLSRLLKGTPWYRWQNRDTMDIEINHFRTRRPEESGG
jgi:hypothetical protein